MMIRRDRVKFRPDVEGIEARLLLSTATGGVDHSRPIRASLMTKAAIDPSAIPPNPLYFPVGEPTPHEQARQKFVAKYVGPFTVGRGRFSGEAQQIYIRGSGGSNQFLHGDTQLAVITPTDTSQPLGGAITQFDRNINTNGSVGMQLVANRSTDLDAAGRPIHLTIYDLKSEESGGAYAAAIATGTVDIRYKPSGRRSPGVLSQGTATIVVRANIYTSGTNGILRNADLNPGGPSQGR